MPSTAKQIAKELGYNRYNLKDPITNEIFGEYYLKQLIKQFDGDIPLALTAYNQGPTRISKLLKRVRGDSLADIIHLLGPDGRAYAKEVLSRVG